MPSPHARLTIHIRPRRGKDPLPTPLPWRPRIFQRQCIWQDNAATTGLQIGVMLRLDTSQLRPQPHAQRPGQHRHPIALALPVANQDGRLLEVEVLHAQRATLDQSQPAAVHQLGHQPADARQVLEHLADLSASQYHRETRRPFCADHGAQIVQRFAKHLSVQKEQRTTGLTLGRRADTALGREMRQEHVHLRRAERIWVPLLMEENETPNPRDVRRFRAGTVVLRSKNRAYLVEKTGTLC